MGVGRFHRLKILSHCEYDCKTHLSLYAMFGGIPRKHKDFCKDVTVHHLMQVYLASNSTAYNVLKVIKEPLVLQPLQKTVYGYLLQYIGNMRNTEVRNFLRFITGSFALVVDGIDILQWFDRCRSQANRSYVQLYS